MGNPSFNFAQNQVPVYMRISNMEWASQVPTIADAFSHLAGLCSDWWREKTTYAYGAGTWTVTTEKLFVYDG